MKFELHTSLIFQVNSMYEKQKELFQGLYRPDVCQLEHDELGDLAECS